jgi:hypothetical protein
MYVLDTDKKESQLLHLGHCPCSPSVKRGSPPFRIVYHFTVIHTFSRIAANGLELPMPQYADVDPTGLP